MNDKGIGFFDQSFDDEPEARAEKARALVAPLMDQLIDMIDEGLYDEENSGDFEGAKEFLENPERRKAVGDLCAMLAKGTDPATLYITINVMMNLLIQNFQQARTFDDTFWERLVNRDEDQLGSVLDATGEITDGKPEKGYIEKPHSDLDDFLKGD